MLAAEQGQSDVVKVLLDAGANVNKLTSDGMTALMLAVTSRMVEVVELLLKANADIKVQNKVESAISCSY